ncbi:MAG: isoprenylcysteine carboxylmethyltransferase family protein [Candidatus Omnitrophota bacterium]|jgi:methyltransferase|nr:MAG: isoprenylcysteine carboxylmethyltransferase family protein [Candidatus Omnitrophota bacterium]
MIIIFIAFSLLLIPVLLIVLNIFYPEARGGIIFSIFAVLIMFERVWETFFTTKETNKYKYKGDWTMVVTSIMYLVTCLVVIAEFFVTNGIKYFAVSMFGISVFILAGVIRYWSVKSLGEHWKIHLVNEDESEIKYSCVKTGPYSFIRHPIYLGIIFELIGISLIANAFYALFIIIFINTPLYIIRAIYEEKLSFIKFGDEYLHYKKTVPMIIPFLQFCRRNSN